MCFCMEVALEMLWCFEALGDFCFSFVLHVCGCEIFSRLVTACIEHVKAGMKFKLMFSNLDMLNLYLDIWYIYIYGIARQVSFLVDLASGQQTCRSSIGCAQPSIRMQVISPMMAAWRRRPLGIYGWCRICPGFMEDDLNKYFWYEMNHI